MFRNLDRSDLFLIFISIGVMVPLIICTINFSFDKLEQDCVKFYKENHYITASCEKYTNKLKEIKQKKE